MPMLGIPAWRVAHMAHPGMVRSLSSRSIPQSDRSSRISRRSDEQPWTLFEQVMQSEVARKPSRASMSMSASLSMPAHMSASSSAASNITEEPDALPERPRPPPHDDAGSAPLPPPARSSVFPPLSTLQRNVLKCAIAYFIGSLFTFVPALARLIGGKEGLSLQGHLVATVSVYFNPAKTVGAMMEADFFCMAGLVFAAFICLGSMSTFWPLELSPGWEWLADFLVLSWIAGAFVFISWSKVWMEKPSYNTACSMISIIIFIVVVKEGGVRVLLQIAFHVALGASISNIICLVMWPQSATHQLQGNITKTLDSFSTILAILTDSFLLREGSQPRAHLSRAVEAHQASFTTLKKNLAEAKTEWLADSRMRDAGGMYDDAVDSLNRLAQHLGGLRSGITQQSELTKSAEERGDEAAKELAADFAELVDDLDGPLSALSNACVQALKQMEGAFHRRAGGSTAAEFEAANALLDRALFTFDSTSNQAILRIYRRSTMAEEAHVPETAPAEESLFLVYWFVFTFQEFAREIVTLGHVMRRIRAREEALARQTGWPLLRWLRSPEFGIPLGMANGRPGLRRRISMHAANLGPGNPRATAAFPRVKPHAPNTAQTPPRESLSFWNRVKRTVWTVASRVREPDMKYSFKTGIALAILAAPAFYDPTRPFFVKYKGEWALISFFVVMTPTIGGTNFLSLHRVLGTLIGGATAAAVYSLFSTQPVILAIFGFLWAIPCFYVIVGMPTYATSGRFVLLTYNLTCLFCYNMREEGITAPSIALQRSAAVIAGVLWAAFVSRFWWPTEARRELTKKLSEFCLEMGWLYTRLVASYSASEDAIANVGQRPRLSNDYYDSRRSLLPLTHDGHVELSHSIGDFMAMELYLQIKLIQMQVLLNQAQNEPRLKGPFPVALYRSILTSLQKILDKLHSMRCVTLREEWFTSVRRDFIVPVNKERKQMVGNIILYFSTLSSAFRTKAPLPPYLPAAEPARQQLVARMRDLPVVRNRQVSGSRQLLYFAYALTMQGVTHELDYLGCQLQDAFGVIGHTRQEFDALFIP